MAQVSSRRLIINCLIVATAGAWASSAMAQYAAEETSPDAPLNGWYATPWMPAVSRDAPSSLTDRDLSDAGAAWHLRVALNVAALSCRDEGSDKLVAEYNTMLTNRKDELASDNSAVEAEFGSTPAGRAAYDHAMTQLYNFFAQPTSQAAFCSAAEQAMQGEAAVATGGLARYARAALPMLDQPAADTYRPDSPWQSPPVEPSPAVTIAAAATVPVTPAAGPWRQEPAYWYPRPRPFRAMARRRRMMIEMQRAEWQGWAGY